MALGIGVIRAGERRAGEIAAYSRAALDLPAAHPAELWVAVARDEALLLGAFQRHADAQSVSAVERRGSGGPEVIVGPGSLHVALRLVEPMALEACDEKHIVNRYVRPLLRALTKTGSIAHYFGRDWVSVAHRPAAWVGFAHDASTRRTLFEAFVAVKRPFATGDRPSFRGKPQGTLEEIGGGAVDSLRVARAVVDAYLAAYPVEPHDTEGPDLPAEKDRATLPVDPPWSAVAEEAIGTIGAGPDAGGVFRVGGDVLVSRDALARLEQRLGATPDDAVGRAVDETLAAPGVALEGVRSLTSFRDVILRARHAPRCGPP